MTGSGPNLAKATVLVSSCDAYADIWRPHFELFFRYWPDCPWRVCLVTNQMRCEDPRVVSLPVGPSRGWANDTGVALEAVDTDYILYTHEDFLLDRRVRTDRVLELLEYLHASGAGYVRLYPCPGPDDDEPDAPSLGRIRPGSMYRVSLQVALWRVSTLRALLKPGEDAWEMEVKGSRRSDERAEAFLSVRRREGPDPMGESPYSYFCTGVEKGLWLPGAVEFCRREGVAIDLSVRPVKSTWRVFARELRKRARALRLGRREQ